MESTSTSTALEARHLVDHLPPGFPRGDEEAIDAVMQLAAFNEQQQHHHHQHPHSNGGDSLQEAGQGEGEAKSSRKRKSDNAGGKNLKVSKDDENHDAAHQNWASFTGSNNEFEHLLHQSGEGQQGNETQQSMDDSSMQQEGGVSTSEGEMLTRHGRPLSTTKRAAQNRAAQRAFRERRDQHVKEVEIKAKQVDQALASAAMHKQRYEELLKTITELRADNSSLRLAVSALGGNAPPPPPVVNFPSLDMHDVDPSTWRNHSFHDANPSSDDKSDNHLDGLSAVAAAAAAAATAAAHAAQDSTTDAPKGEKAQQ